MDELDLFRNFRRGVAAPSAAAQRRASARLADEVVGRETAARLRHSRRRWPLVALASVILMGGLLVTPALGLGDRLLSLFQGKPTPLDVQAPAWSRDGRTIVFVSWRDGNGEVYAMDADGSSPRNLTQQPAKDVRPAWSPDGRSIAFVSIREDRQPIVCQQVSGPIQRCTQRAGSESEIYVMNADGSGKRNLTRSRASDDYPTWSPDGQRIAFLRPATRRYKVAGRDVIRRGYHLYVVNADGSGLRNLMRNQRPTDTHQRLIWSPDGRRIAFAAKPDWCLTGPRPCLSSHLDIYVMNADGSGKRKLTHNERYNTEPAWSPDGRKIAFRSTRSGNRDIYVMNADGSGRRNLTRNPAQDGSPSWSPDGRRIAFVSNRDGRPEAHVMNADGSGQRSLTLQDS